MVTGVDFGYQKNLGRGPFGADFPSINAFQPSHPYTRQDAERFLALGGPALSILNTESRNRALGGYAQDQIEITSRLKTLLGVRVDRYSQTFIERNSGTISRQVDVAASPRVGLVYQLSLAVSLYGSFSRSFNPVSPTLRSSASQTFDPERGVQYEAGIKLTSFNNRMLSTLAVYDIVKRNVLTADPSNPQFSVQTGRQRSKGIEVDITGTPTTGWNVLFGYAFTQPQVTADNSFPVGNLLPNAARHSGNVWTTYEFNRSRIRGLGFGAGLQATSKRFGDILNSFVLPGYARVDTTVFYSHTRNDRMSYKLSFNLNNLFDRTYYDASVYGVYINPGAPRTALVSLTMTRR
jgi:iron complex outermembrane receptor protein